MSVIRRVNADTEDLMYDVIHDLVERADVFGLPNTGMYESRDELCFNNKYVTTVGISPDGIHVIAAPHTKDGEQCILIRFYCVSVHKKPGVNPEELCRYEFVVPTQEGSGLTRTALAVALLFFAQRGWFNDFGEEIEGGVTQSDRIRKKVTDWAGKYFTGYEERATEIFLEYTKLTTRHLDTSEQQEATK